MALVPRKKTELQQASTDVKLVKQIGAGGNGVVYAGTHSSLGSVAVKFMLNNDKKRYGRFCDEVKVVTGLLQGSPRVLPILEAYLAEPDIDVPYYIMPLAQPATKVLTGIAWDAKLLALAELAEGLVDIHKSSVAHRDIKPENLFFFSGTYRYGDFGIASFPDKLGLTEENEPMGPWAYMAREMLDSPTTADPYKADIYSLAKTVWAILTEEKVPFAGQYSATGRESLSVGSQSKGFVTEPLESLLSDCTVSTPSARPTASEFAARLRDVIQLQSDFRRGNTAQWAAAELDAVSGPGLVRARWETVEYIASALGVLSRRDGLNHFFFPEGGGQQISGVSLCENGAMLSLEIPFGGKLILKPRRLTLERFVGKPELGYAVLETAEVTPLGVDKRYATTTSEMLRQVGDCDYVADDSNDNEPANSSMGVSCERRFKEGIFVFAPTGGIYNAIDDYMGTTQACGVESLRELFQGYFEELNAEVEVDSMRLVPFVRLLKTSNCPRQELVLEHLDMPLLQQLIQLEDALVAERKSCQSHGRESIFESVLAGPTAAEFSAKQLLEEMTPQQLAETFALLNIGRNVRTPEEMKENTAENIASNHRADYVSEKLGNSFLRKGLARFGLSIIMPPAK
jgi:serine/threonine-protein kinase